MLFHLRHLIRSVPAALRGSWRSRRATRRPLRVEMLTAFLRRTTRLALDGDVAQIRAEERPVPIVPALRRRVTLVRGTVAGVETLTVTPVAGARGRLLYLHGGGYTFCSTATHRAHIARLAAVCGLECVAPNYRLAPESPFPAAVDDALAVYRELAGDADFERFWIGGDSAGGGLALATMLSLRAAGEPLPRAVVLLSPWVDLTCRGQSIVDNAPRDYLSLDALRFFAECYLGETPPTEPLASPLYADLAGLPPLLVQVGGAEVLLSEGRDLTRRARQAGVDVTLQEWDGAIHAFQIFATVVPEALAAVRAIRTFIDRTRVAGDPGAGRDAA